LKEVASLLNHIPTEEKSFKKIFDQSGVVQAKIHGPERISGVLHKRI